MGIKEILQRIMEKKEREPEEEIPDDETRDKFLRSLRRQRRTQMEEIEKESLKKQIADFQRNRVRTHLFGIKDNKKSQDGIIKAISIKKEINMLKERNTMLKGRKTAKKSILRKKEMSFLSKANL